MGMPISLALRGRHADDDAAGRGLGRRRGRAARGRPGLQHLPRRLLDLPARPRRARPRRLPARGRRGAGARRAGRASSPAAPSTSRRPPPDGAAVLDPSGVVKGWAVERAAAAARGAATTPTSACPPAATWSAAPPTPEAPRWRIGIEDPHDPTPAGRRRARAHGAVATSAPPTAGATSSTPAPGVVPHGVASVTVVDRSLTWADIDATAAFAHGRGAADWLRTRPGRTGLVVWADGSAEVVGAAQAAAATR